MSRRTVAFHTFGCKVNQYETEELRHQLTLGQFDVVPMEERADVYVVNSCSVTADADSSCRQLVRKLLREQPESRIVVTGCYAERAPEELRALSPKIDVFGNHDKPLIAVSLGVPTSCVQEAASSGVTALAERTRAYIKVQDGCDAHCTYCIIPSVRPNLVCRSPELVLREAAHLIERGFKEIVLTGVRLGRYEWTMPGSNSAWDLTQLVQSLLDLSGDFRIRLSSIEITEIPDALIEVMRTHRKMCQHFHIPMQSGDDETLKLMGRWYTASFYRERVRFIRSQIPDIAISADVIVGFPGETDARFQNTASLALEEGLSRLHVFRYSVRPGTPAERLPHHVEGSLKAKRTRELVKLDFTLRERFAARFVGKPVRFLQEADGEGYTAHYVRARANQPLTEGRFHEIIPLRVSENGCLEN